MGGYLWSFNLDLHNPYFGGEWKNSTWKLVFGIMNLISTSPEQQAGTRLHRIVWMALWLNANKHGPFFEEGEDEPTEWQEESWAHPMVKGWLPVWGAGRCRTGRKGSRLYDSKLGCRCGWKRRHVTLGSQDFKQTLESTADWEQVTGQPPPACLLKAGKPCPAAGVQSLGNAEGQGEKSCHCSPGHTGWPVGSDQGTMPRAVQDLLLFILPKFISLKGLVVGSPKWEGRDHAGGWTVPPWEWSCRGSLIKAVQDARDGSF